MLKWKTIRDKINLKRFSLRTEPFTFKYINFHAFGWLLCAFSHLCSISSNISDNKVKLLLYLTKLLNQVYNGHSHISYLNNYLTIITIQQH